MITKTGDFIFEIFVNEMLEMWSATAAENFICTDDWEEWKI